MEPIDLLEAGLPQTFSWEKAVSVKLNKAKHKTRCGCSHLRAVLSANSLSHIRLSATPRALGPQSPLSMGFSRQEYWSGLPCPLPGDLPNLGIEPRSPTVQADSFLGGSDSKESSK